MKRLAVFLFWTLLFLAIFLGIDQMLVRVETRLPVLAEVRSFYVDFRTRLLHLGKQPPSKAQPGERRVAPPVVPPPSPKKKAAPAKPTALPSAEAPSPRYLYADAHGELHFVDSLNEVPAAYRKDAQRLER